MIDLRNWFKKTKIWPKYDEAPIYRPGAFIPVSEMGPKHIHVVANYNLKRKATLILRKEDVKELAALLDFVMNNTQETERIYTAARFHKMLRPRIRTKTLTLRKPRKIPKQFTRKKV